MALSPEQIETLKQVDNSTKSAINGYIRKAQQSLDMKREIPIEIIQFILVFYYFMQYEYFDIHADDIAVSGDYKDIIIKQEIEHHYYGSARGDWHNMTFGAVSIPSMSDTIVMWTFEMLANSRGTGLSLGIINSKDAHIESSKMDLSEEDAISSYIHVL